MHNAKNGSTFCVDDVLHIMYKHGMTYDVKQIRIELDMTQQQLADALAMNNNTVSRWETGKVAIPRRMQIALDMLKASLSKQEAAQ